MIWQEIEANSEELEKSIDNLLPNWIAYAKANRDYRVAKAKAILTLKSKGYPATLIPDIVKGLDEVAELDFKRIVAEATYKSNIEAINVLKQKAQDLRMYFEKEYSRKENQ